jgi:methylenetetrahydrofolate dehydrogenase (NADP+)/methenyltetrahydrofolate cyclohydrolase
LRPFLVLLLYIAVFKHILERYILSTIIDGKAFSAKLRSAITRKVSILKQQHSVTPGLAVVLVGEDPASQVYVRSKGKQTTEAGMNSYEHKLPADTGEVELLKLIDQLNNDASVHGILVQLPLPDHIDEGAVINSVAVDKDVDGFHLSNVGRLSTGAEGIVPCTPLGSMMMLKDHLGDLSGLKAIVVGRSNIVGKPMAALLLAESCTVTIAHSRTRDLPAECRQADILVAAVGRPEMVKGDWIKPGATVIDVGINRIENDDGSTKLVGDVEFSSASEVAGAITPVPGGVGPMTIACLLHNTLQQACRLNGLAVPE